jgi:hypothetical protein
MRILPFPAFTVARAIAVFLLPLVNKTLVEVEDMVTLPQPYIRFLLQIHQQ